MRFQRKRSRFIAQMRLNILLLFISVTIFGIGCDVINPTEEVPTYVKIDSFQFKQVDPANEGPASTGITSVWIYYNNNPVGVFDLPCNVPVITEGASGMLSVAPGIALNGLLDLQPQYTFYRFDTVTLQTNPGNVFEYTPTTSYIETAKFRYKEDFETGSTIVPFSDGLIGDTSLVRTLDKSKVFAGGASGYIYVDGTNTYAEITNNTPFDIGTGEAYLEVNYKCSIPFEVGLYNTLNNGFDTYSYFSGVNPTDTWKKIYIDLASYTSANQGTDFKLMIRCGLPDGLANGYVLLDNIKVVSF